MKKPHHIYPFVTHIEDTDMTGVIYHPNYLSFMERARSLWIEELGLGLNEQAKQQIIFLVHSLKIEFLKPARAHERLEVVTSIKKLGFASVIFEQYLRQAAYPDKILCKAELKIASVGPDYKPKAVQGLKRIFMGDET